MDFGYKRLYIGGCCTDSVSGKRREVFCPATEEKIGDIAWGVSADAELALAEAERGFRNWSSLSIDERTSWMMKLRNAVAGNEKLLREAVMYETGKTYEGTAEDFKMLIDSLEFYPSAVKSLQGRIIPDGENAYEHKIVTEPAGVVVAYLAWNFPLLNIAYKLGPALAAGCSIIIRTSELASVSAGCLGEILEELKFPPGVVNFLYGPVSEIAETLTKSSITKVITMIASSDTGKRVIADSTSTMKKISAELGGNAPFIVCEDADIDKAVDVGVAMKFGNCGQVCVSPNRFIIHKNRYEDFVRKFTDKTRALRIGFGDASFDMGPLISDSSRSRIMKMISDDIKSGAKLLTGGRIPEKLKKGYFMEPAVLTEVTPEMRCFREEVFGPVASMMKFSTLEEALALANDTTAGLSSYVFSESNAIISFFTDKLEFGEVHVNGVKHSIELPHIGIKESGIGMDCSEFALEDYIVRKRITIARSADD